jgi:hypothetical protein
MFCDIVRHRATQSDTKIIFRVNRPLALYLGLKLYTQVWNLFIYILWAKYEKFEPRYKTRYLGMYMPGYSISYLGTNMSWETELRFLLLKSTT